jgi:hypothetical protein
MRTKTVLIGRCILERVSKALNPFHDRIGPGCWPLCLERSSLSLRSLCLLLTINQQNHDTHEPFLRLSRDSDCHFRRVANLHVSLRAGEGTLRIHPTNPRYFTDGTTNGDGALKAVYLTGAHTWNTNCASQTSTPRRWCCASTKPNFASYGSFPSLHRWQMNCGGISRSAGERRCRWNPARPWSGTDGLGAMAKCWPFPPRLFGKPGGASAVPLSCLTTVAATAASRPSPRFRSRSAAARLQLGPERPGGAPTLGPLHGACRRAVHPLLPEVYRALALRG